MIMMPCNCSSHRCSSQAVQTSGTPQAGQVEVPGQRGDGGRAPACEQGPVTALVQKWLQRWTRSVISPRSVTRQEGARWTSRIPAVYLGRTRRSAAPAVGPPGPQMPVLPLCRCPTVTGAAMTLQVRRMTRFRNPTREWGVAHCTRRYRRLGLRGGAAASMSPLVWSSRSAWVIPLRLRQRLAS